MKRITLFLAAAAAAMSLTSCEALENSLVFVFTGSTVYDGQTALLGVTYNNDVAWEVSTESQKYITLEADSDGKNCIARFKLPLGTDKQTKVTVTCKDKNNSSVEPHTGDITIAPWRLHIFKEQSDGTWQDLTGDQTGSGHVCNYNGAAGQTTMSLKNAAAGAGRYKIKMMALNEKNTYASFAPIFSLNLFGNPGHKVYWEGNTDGMKGLTTASDTKAEEVYEKIIDFSVLPTVDQKVSVYLGVERSRDNKTVLCPKDDAKSAIRAVVFTAK